MKKNMTGLLVIAGLVTGAFSKGVVLPELAKPVSMVVDARHLYVAESGTVLVYSREDFKLEHRFGRQGSGPGEFPGTIQRIVPSGDTLWVSSQNKLSIFRKNGELQREFKVVGGIFNSNLYPVGEGIVGTSMVAGEGGTMSFAITLYREEESHLKKDRILISYPFGTIRKMNFMNAVYAFTFTVAGERVYAADPEGFKVHVFDREGEELFGFEHPCDPVPFGEDLIERIHKGMKRTMPQAQYEALKDRFYFPEYLPAILMLQASGQHIYALSPTEDIDRSICRIMDLEGRLLDQKTVKFIMNEQMQSFPFYIHHRELMQLVENEETEDWELMISPL